MIVKVDSREQRPLPFKVCGNVSKVLTIGLPFGDYWCEYEDGCEMPIAFERKSIADLFGTLSNEDGIRRHKVKIEKAKAVGVELYLIVDGTLSDVLDGASHSSVDPNALVKRVFTFKVKYGLHPIFCTDDKEMVRYMIETWEAWGRTFKSGKAAKCTKTSS